MSKPAPQILRDTAALVIRRGLDGRTFPLSVDRARDLHGRDAPESVRRLAALVRFRHAGATPAEVSALLVAEAEMMKGAAVEWQG